jgi:hypothetical protein
VTALLKRIRKWLHSSRRVHIRERPVNDLVSCIGLMDRFMDGRLRYALEWDDFISWNHENPGIESIRQSIAALEPELFSRDEQIRDEAVRKFLVERNRIAAIAGFPGRNLE